MNWREIFFPVLSDIKEINKETDTNLVAKNNLELANNDEKFQQILKEIKKQQESSLKVKLVEQH